MIAHNGYTSEDYNVDEGWARIFCAPLPDGSCGLLIVAHHDQHHSDEFDHLTEANLGMVTGMSHPEAMARVQLSRDKDAYHPAAYRRLSRLLVNGELINAIKDTLSERGLQRAIAFTDSEKPDTTRLAACDRAGFRTEIRNNKPVRILDLE